MALTDFFSINLPYGMEKNEKGEWMVFNREYKPLGFNSKKKEVYENYPIFTKFSGLTDECILKIASRSEEKEEDGKMKIYKFWFYNDETNPIKNSNNWLIYCNKIKQISKYKRKKL